MNKNMVLVSSVWKDIPTFKLIPILQECPYNECIFDPENKMLAIVSKEKKEAYHMLPKLNEFGDVSMVKNNKRPDGKPYAEQRVSTETFYEYFIRDAEDIRSLVNLFAINSEHFDYNAFITAEVEKKEKVTAE